MKCQRLDVAARRVGVNPCTPYEWMENDPEFKRRYERARQVVGDHYVGQLKTQSKRNIIGTIFLIKGYKPEFRDKNADVQGNSEARLATQLLMELRQAGPVPMLEANV